MITQPFLFQLFAAEEPLTGRLQEITRQVHSWKCVYRKRWQILLWLKHCWIYTSTHSRMSSSPSIDEHKRMDLMASHLQAQINKTTSSQPPSLSALKTPQGLGLWTLLKLKNRWVHQNKTTWPTASATATSFSKSVGKTSVHTWSKTRFFSHVTMYICTTKRLNAKYLLNLIRANTVWNMSNHNPLTPSVFLSHTFPLLQNRKSPA